MERREFIIYSIGIIAAGNVLLNQDKNLVVKTELASNGVSLNFLKTSVFNSCDENISCYRDYKSFLDSLTQKGDLISRDILEVTESKLVFQDVWSDKNKFDQYFKSDQLKKLLSILKNAQIDVTHQA